MTGCLGVQGYFGLHCYVRQLGRCHGVQASKVFCLAILSECDNVEGVLVAGDFNDVLVDNGWAAG